MSPRQGRRERHAAQRKLKRAEIRREKVLVATLSPERQELFWFYRDYQLFNERIARQCYQELRRLQKEERKAELALQSQQHSTAHQNT